MRVQREVQLEKRKIWNLAKNISYLEYQVAVLASFSQLDELNAEGLIPYLTEIDGLQKNATLLYETVSKKARELESK